jgi:O-antigen ligase
MKLVAIRNHFKPRQAARTADGLACLVAISLPWSTTATGILVVLWLISLMPVLDFDDVRRELLSGAGGLPVLLWTLAAFSMLWADTGWHDRIAELGGYHKLLALPLLLAQFRKSERGWWPVLGFFGSAVMLLLVSWGLVLTPGLSWRGKWVLPGIPVKDYILQSEVFAICIFGLVAAALKFWGAGERRNGWALVILAALFLANIVYVALARTTLVVIAFLVILFGWRQFGARGVVAAFILGGAVALLAWNSSSYLRDRVIHAVEEVEAYRTADEGTSAGLRLEFWRKSIDFVTAAPVAGHGSGMIRELFRRNASSGTTASSNATSNPHNQFFAVAIHLGLMGSGVLIAMWLAHLLLFRASGMTAWFGLVVTGQNIVASSFNSHLFDFTQGWLYVFGVGVLGGLALQGAPALPTRKIAP